MTDLFARLAKRTLDLMPVVQPKIASRFAPEEAMASEDADLEVESLFESKGDPGLSPGREAEKGLGEEETGETLGDRREREESSMREGILTVREDWENQEITSEESVIGEASPTIAPGSQLFATENFLKEGGSADRELSSQSQEFYLLSSPGDRRDEIS